MRRFVLALGCAAVANASCSSPGETAFAPGKGYVKDGGTTDVVADVQQQVDGGAAEAADVTGTEAGDAVSEAVGPPPCTPGLITCKNNQKQQCEVDGTWGPAEDCGTKICSSLLGCVTCLPGTGTCNAENTAATRCLPDGSGFYEEVCDPDLGSTCDATEGLCTGACAPGNLGKSYIGCEYYPTVTANTQLTNTSAHFAVAVSNTTASDAVVKIYKGQATSLLTQVTVAANSVQVVHLPWNELRTATASKLFAGGAYHLKSTQPVTVYQFNPLEYQNGGGATYTNDASLLLPATAWGTKYVVASRNTWQWSGFSIHGFYAVVASKDNTTVTVQPSATGGQMTAGGGIQANGTGQFVLNAGDVMQAQSSDSTAADPTGTVITADKPIAVFGGHDCTFIPASVGYCDHIEEQMFPANTLSKNYVVTPPSLPSMAQPKAFFVRVIAVEPNTTLTYDPPSAWPAALNNTGDYIEIDSGSSFKLTASNRVLVAQYMKGQDAGGGSGDPAMALAVTTQQFRKSYLFHSPVNYESNYVNIIADLTAQVTLDGAPVLLGETIGATGLGVARVKLPGGGDGNHRLESSTPAGVTVYGYGQYTSYWYPGGLNLTDL
jgi:hypothetical protein